MQRKRILFVTPYLPSPPRFGGQRRLHGLMTALAETNDVSILSLVDPNEDQTAAVRATEEYCRRVVTIPNHRYNVQGRGKRAFQLRSMVSRHSYEYIVYRQRSFQRALDEWLEREHFDVVHFEFAQMAAYRLPRSKRGNGALPRFCLDEHNIEYDILRRTADGESTPLRKLYGTVNWRKLRTEELRAWSRFDGTTLTSVRDEELLRTDAPRTRTAVVPNGVDISFFGPRPERAPTQPMTVLFFGAINYYPNTEGLLFYLKEIHPKIKARYPEMKLSIVGPNPPESITAWRGPGIEITGFVDDVRPYIERSTAVVAPLLIGGGTRLKILEAMAMNKAVVSTTIGAEGLDVTSGRDVLIADDPETFASEVGRLLDDAALVTRLGDAARRLVEDRYSWHASVRRLSAFYEELVTNSAA
jgi:glycosyltransferase involved in cell wall biosynthesis